MQFEDLEARAGDSAAKVGRNAPRPPMPQLLAARRRRTAVTGWTVTVVAIVAISALALFVADPGPGVAVADGSTTSTVASTTTTTTPPTTTTGSPIVGAVGGSRQDCPITVPGPDSFTPVEATPDGPPSFYGSAWYGTSGLWTLLGADGEVWANLPVAAGGSLTQKTFWWSEDFELMNELAPNITVTLEAIDGSVPSVEMGGPGTNGTQPELGEFMLVGLDIPAPGCWKITAHYRDASVSYVAWVGP